MTIEFNRVYDLEEATSMTLLEIQIELANRLACMLK